MIALLDIDARVGAAARRSPLWPSDDADPLYARGTRQAVRLGIYGALVWGLLNTCAGYTDHATLEWLDTCYPAPPVLAPEPQSLRA